MITITKVSLNESYFAHSLYTVGILKSKARQLAHRLSYYFCIEDTLAVFSTSFHTLVSSVQFSLITNVITAHNGCLNVLLTTHMTPAWMQGNKPRTSQQSCVFLEGTEHLYWFILVWLMFYMDTQWDAVVTINKQYNTSVAFVILA